MAVRATTSGGLGLLLLGLGLACTRAPETAAPRAEPLRFERDCAQVAAGGGDAQAVRLADEVAGFGGFFVDAGAGGRGVPTAYLTDLSQAAQAAHRLGPVLGVPEGALRFVQGRYTARQLAEWRCRAEDVLAGEAWTFSGLDAARNRVAVGLADAAAQQRASTLLARAGLPLDAFALELSALTSLDAQPED